MKKLLLNVIRAVSLVMCGVILFSTPMSIFAANDERWIVQYDDEIGKEIVFDTLTGESIFGLYGFDQEENLVQLDIQEYKDILNIEERGIEAAKKMSIGNISSNGFLEDFLDDVGDTGSQKSNWGYSRSRWVRTSGPVRVNGTAIKVSADSKGPSTINQAYAHTVTNSFSLAGGASSDVPGLIKANAGITWQNSLSRGVTTGYGFSVPSGRTGFIRFTPYMHRVSGNTYRDHFLPSGFCYQSDYLGVSHGFSPVRLSNGTPDGLFQLVLY